MASKGRQIEQYFDKLVVYLLKLAAPGPIRVSNGSLNTGDKDILCTRFGWNRDENFLYLDEWANHILSVKGLSAKAIKEQIDAFEFVAEKREPVFPACSMTLQAMVMCFNGLTFNNSLQSLTMRLHDGHIYATITGGTYQGFLRFDLYNNIVYETSESWSGFLDLIDSFSEENTEQWCQTSV